MISYIFIGCVLLLIQLPLGWTAGYLLKTMGFAMCMAGSRELSRRFQSRQNRSDRDPPVRISGLGGIAVWRTVRERLSLSPESDPAEVRLSAADMLEKNAVAGIALGVICSAVTAVFEYALADKTPETALWANLTAIALGTVCTLAALRLVYGVTAFFEEGDRNAKALGERHRGLIMTDNFTDILRLRSVFERTAICALVNLVCDILNRLLPGGSAQTFTGFFAAISKVTLYVFAAVTAVRAYEVYKGVKRCQKG